MGSKQRAVKELNKRLDRMWENAIVHIKPTEKSVLSGFVGHWHATDGPDPVPIQVYESKPGWWLDSE